MKSRGSTPFANTRNGEIAKDWLDIDHDHIVLIDGPILTQNLLSQDAAHNLLAAITSSHQAIGFIKELSANPLLVAIWLRSTSRGKHLCSSIGLTSSKNGSGMGKKQSPSGLEPTPPTSFA